MCILVIGVLYFKLGPRILTCQSLRQLAELLGRGEGKRAMVSFGNIQPYLFLVMWCFLIQAGPKEPYQSEGETVSKDLRGQKSKGRYKDMYWYMCISVM